jgi:hypothetical protein
MFKIIGFTTEEGEKIDSFLTELFPNESVNLTIEKRRAGGIVSYYTSPLALRDGYELETKRIAGQNEYVNGEKKFIYNENYSKYLEKKLCKT